MSEINFVQSTAEASKGGFGGIKKVRGLLVDMTKVSQPDSWGSDFKAKDQIMFTLEDAAILEMAPGEEPFELKENKYVGYVSYAEPGKVPNANSGYMKGFVASAEKLGKKPADFIGQYVTLEKKKVVCFQKSQVGDDKKPILDSAGKKVLEDITANVWTFLVDEETNSTSVRDYIRDLLTKPTPLNKRAAKRKLILDTRAKQYPEYKQALDDGKLADMLELTLVGEGDQAVFTLPEGEGNPDATGSN